MSTTTAVYALTKPANLGDSGVWGGPVDTNFDTIDDVMARPKIVQNAPTYNVGGITTCDLSLARVFTLTVSGASTLAFSNVPSSTFAVYVDLLITNGAAFVLTFPASVTWLQGTAPTFQTAGVDLVRLVTRDGGTTWYGVHLGKNLSVSGVVKAANGLQSGVVQNTAGVLNLLSDGNIGWVITAVTGKPRHNGVAGVVCANAALATNATAGFLYLPTCAGTPTGVPATETGTAAAVYDTTANKIWVYNGSWRGVVVT